MESITDKEAVTPIVAVPFGVGTDHAEGVTLVSESPLSLMVSYDSPQPLRIDGEDGSGVRADVFEV